MKNNVIIFLYFIMGLLYISPLFAHETKPSIVTLSFTDNTHFKLSIKTNLEALLTGIDPKHKDTNESPKAEIYNGLRDLTSNQLRDKFIVFREQFLNSLQLSFNQTLVKAEMIRVDIPHVGDLSELRTSTLYLRGTIPKNATTATWAWPKAYGINILKIELSDGSYASSEWLRNGALSNPVPINQQAIEISSLKVINDYLILGFEHIIPKGLDHILFVLGLFLLSLKWRPLLYQITAFTVAHTITLGLTTYGLISLSPSWVEPLISASIVYIAVENIVSSHLKLGRIALVFCFGLLHGMGFAGILIELGLPRSDYLIALLSFNIGVELAQLMVIFCAYLLIAHGCRNKPWYRHRIVIPASLAIALVGLYWTVKRLLF